MSGNDCGQVVIHTRVSVIKHYRLYMIWHWPKGLTKVIAGLTESNGDLPSGMTGNGLRLTLTAL